MLKRWRFHGLGLALAGLILGGLALFWFLPPWVNAAAPRILPLGLHAAYSADYRAEARGLRLPAVSLNLVREVLPRHGEAALQHLNTPIPTPTPQVTATQRQSGSGSATLRPTATRPEENPPAVGASPTRPGETPTTGWMASQTPTLTFLPTQPLEPTASASVKPPSWPTKTPKPTRTPTPLPSETPIPTPTAPVATATTAPYPPPPGSTPSPTASPPAYPAP